MDQRGFYEQFNRALQYFEILVKNQRKHENNNKACYYIFFDKNFRPYLIQTPIEFFNRYRKPVLGLHKFFVFTLPFSSKETDSVAYLSMEITHPKAHLAKLQILKKEFLRLGIARKLVAFFEYFSYINNKKEAEGVAFPLTDNINLDQLKEFYEKMGYTITPDYSLEEKFYTITKKLKYTQIKEYREQMRKVSIGNIHFKVIVPKEFSKEPLELFNKPLISPKNKVDYQHEY